MLATLKRYLCSSGWQINPVKIQWPMTSVTFLEVQWSRHTRTFPLGQIIAIVPVPHRFLRVLEAACFTFQPINRLTWRLPSPLVSPFQSSGLQSHHWSHPAGSLLPQGPGNMAPVIGHKGEARSGSEDNQDWQNPAVVTDSEELVPLGL